MLGSIINLMSLLFCVKKNFKTFNFIVGGDDFLISCKSNVSDSFIESIKDRVKMLGMRFKFLDKKFFNSNKISECPTFYKYCIYKGKAITPTQAMLERVLMPWNRGYKTDIELFQFLCDVMPSLGAPMSHLYIYYRFYQHMYRIVTGSHIRMSEIIAKHKAINDKMNLSKDVKLLHKYKVIKVDDTVATVFYVLITTQKLVEERKKILEEIETFF
jgi:hypothetical protein